MNREKPKYFLRFLFNLIWGIAQGCNYRIGIIFLPTRLLGFPQDWKPFTIDHLSELVHETPGVLQTFTAFHENENWVLRMS